MLEFAALPGPYVLVAHSYGGLIVRQFARRYRDRVAALVLVDTLEEGSYFRPDVLKLYARFCGILAAVGALQALGLPRLWRSLFPRRRRARRLAPRCDGGTGPYARPLSRHARRLPLTCTAACSR